MKNFLMILCTAIACSAFAAEDIMIADFEGDSYGNWKVEGDAFGSKPAKGTLSGQMAVSGYQGKGLVNTYYGGDKATGKLTSEPFEIKRQYINFLIGGGMHPEETCMNLLVDGKVLRTVTGPNDRQGGTEELSLKYWDVKELIGKTAKIQIIDKHTGGWGHINIDQIVQSDTKPVVMEYLASQKTKCVFFKHYLLFPIQNGGKKANIDIEINGADVRQFDAEIAISEDKIDYWTFLDLSEFAGKEAVVKVSGATRQGFELIAQSDQIPGSDKFYKEALRPQFHFSQKVGWINDANGMVYYDGEYHLYFQHNPYGWKWGNMHWGHAVSKDLLHWEQLPIAIYNKRRGDWAYSGSAVVDENNTAGWQSGDEKVIVAAWTSTGRGECVAYSNDRGRTFTEFEGNPVVVHKGRDPKVIWYAPGKHWVMTLYDESPEYGQNIAFYTSNDLKKWQVQSHVPGYYECPEFFELDVDGDANNTRWILMAGDAQYAIGSFDGKVFKPEHEGKNRLHYGNYYASQLFNNTPDGRQIQIGWTRGIDMHDMPFNQTFTFPHNLTLRTTTDGIRLFAKPIKEIEKLYDGKHSIANVKLSDNYVGIGVSGELFEILATFDIGNATEIGLCIGDEKLAYDVNKKQLDGVSLAPVDGKITIQVLVDRPMLEIIGNDGRVYVTKKRQVHGKPGEIKAFASGGEANLLNLKINKLKSIWE